MATLSSRYEQSLNPEQNHFVPKQFVSVLFFFVALLTLWFGLRPFNFMAPNDVQVDTAHSRAIFNQTLIKGKQESRGLAFTSQAVTFNDGKGLTLQLRLTPQRRPDGLGHIVSLYDGQDQAIFSITQWQDHLELFSRSSRTTKGYQERSVRNLLLPGKPISLTITSSPDATTVFINSLLVRRVPGFFLLQPTETIKGQLLIGNNAHGTQPWHGSIEEIAIYNQSATESSDGLPANQPLIHYTFDSLDKETVPNTINASYALSVSEHFTPLARNLLTSFPLNELSSTWLRKDILINIFGFIPLSLCFALVVAQSRLRPWKQCIAVVTFCFLFSLTIEAAQAYLPKRDSSLMDLLCNTLGGGLTAALSSHGNAKNKYRYI